MFQWRYHKTTSQKSKQPSTLGGRPLVSDGRVVDLPPQLLTQCCVVLYHASGLTKHQNGLTTALILLHSLDQEWKNGRYVTARLYTPPARCEHDDVLINTHSYHRNKAYSFSTVLAHSFWHLLHGKDRQCSCIDSRMRRRKIRCKRN